MSLMISDTIMEGRVGTKQCESQAMWMVSFLGVLATKKWCNAVSEKMTYGRKSKVCLFTTFYRGIDKSETFNGENVYVNTNNEQFPFLSHKIYDTQSYQSCKSLALVMKIWHVWFDWWRLLGRLSDMYTCDSFHWWKPCIMLHLETDLIYVRQFNDMDIS